MKKIISLIVCVAMLAAALAMTVPANANGADGLTFTATTSYVCDKDVANINTFEAVLSLPENVTGRGGVIIGNYDQSPCVSFEIDENGVPRVYTNPVIGNASDTNFRFYSVHVNTGEKLHLAIVRDGGKVTCYVNGEFAEEMEDTYSDALTLNGLALGGDLRELNPHYFKGTLYSATMFSDARTEDEIAADASGALVNTDSLIAHYDLTNVSKRDVISDASGNGYDMRHRFGLTFDKDSLYDTAKEITEIPRTFEATVCFPDSTDNDLRGGVILGNHPNAGNVSFEIAAGGLPRLYTEGGNYVFGESTDGYTVDLYTGKPEHIAIVVDEAQNSVLCYHNGKLLGQEKLAESHSYNAKGLVMGGDLRLKNDQYFKGNILNAAIFSSARSLEDIKNDMGTIPTDSSLIAWYDTSSLENASIISDKSGNGYDMKRRMLWMDETKERVLGKDYAYSFAVIGDTQVIARDEVDGKFDGYFAKIYDYVVTNKESKNIQFVMGLGDITDTFSWYADSATHTPKEWELAMANIKKMDGVVPYSIVRGNHDEVQFFNEYVKYEDYKNVLDGSFEENMLNTYQMLDIGEVKYLIFSLDYGPSDEVLKWASDIIEANPDRNVIITTHAYLFRDGTTLDDNDECPPSEDPISIGKNDGDDMWDKLIKKHENIVLVMSGHDPSPTIVKTETQGDNGNVVTQLLIDPQNLDKDLEPMGMVAMLYFSEDGKNVDVEWYSTIQERFYREENVFSMTLDTVDHVEPDDDTDEDNSEENNSNNNGNIENNENNAADKNDGNDDDVQNNGGVNADSKPDADEPIVEEEPKEEPDENSKDDPKDEPSEPPKDEPKDAEAETDGKESQNETDKTQTNKKDVVGCGSSANASALLIALIPLMLCVIIRRKKTEN